MSSAQASPLRCRHCDEVIGVYEPMVVVSRGLPVRTSLTARKDDPPDAHEACFHADCFAERQPG